MSQESDPGFRNWAIIFVSAWLCWDSVFVMRLHSWWFWLSFLFAQLVWWRRSVSVLSQSSYGLVATEGRGPSLLTSCFFDAPLSHHGNNSAHPLLWLGGKHKVTEVVGAEKISWLVIPGLGPSFVKYWLDAAFSVNATHSSFFQMPLSVSITHKTFCEIHNSTVLPFLTLDKTSHRATEDVVTTILLPWIQLFTNNDS